MAWLAGIMNEKRMPEKRELAARCQIRIAPVEIRKASTREFSTMAPLVQRSRSRFSTRSDMTPPRRDSISVDTLQPALTQPRAKAEPVSWYTSHPCATVLIWKVAEEASLPSHNHRK